MASRLNPFFASRLIPLFSCNSLKSFLFVSYLNPRHGSRFNFCAWHFFLSALTPSHVQESPVRSYPCPGNVSGTFPFFCTVIPDIKRRPRFLRLRVLGLCSSAPSCERPVVLKLSSSPICREASSGVVPCIAPNGLQGCRQQGWPRPLALRVLRVVIYDSSTWLTNEFWNWL